MSSSSSMGSNGREALVELLTPETYLPPSSSSSGARVSFVEPTIVRIPAQQDNSSGATLWRSGSQPVQRSDSKFGENVLAGPVSQEKKRPAFEVFVVLGLLGLAVFGLLIGLRYMMKKVNDLSRAVEAKTRPVLSVDQLEDIRRTLMTETETRVEEVRRIADANTANIDKLQQMIQQLAVIQLASMGGGQHSATSDEDAAVSQDNSESNGECEGDTCTFDSSNHVDDHDKVNASNFQRPQQRHSDEAGEDDGENYGAEPSEFFAHAANLSGFFHPVTQGFVVEVGGTAKEVGTTTGYSVTLVEESVASSPQGSPSSQKNKSRSTKTTHETTDVDSDETVRILDSEKETPSASETSKGPSSPSGNKGHKQDSEVHVAEREKTTPVVTMDHRRRAKSSSNKK